MNMLLATFITHSLSPLLPFLVWYFVSHFKSTLHTSHHSIAVQPRVDWLYPRKKPDRRQRNNDINPYQTSQHIVSKLLMLIYCGGVFTVLTTQTIRADMLNIFDQPHFMYMILLHQNGVLALMI